MRAGCGARPSNHRRSDRGGRAAYSTDVRAAHLPALALVTLAAAAAAAQAPPISFPTKVEIVTVDAVVLDGGGRPVPGLTREDFVVEEDGQPQEIVSFEDSVSEPAAVAATPTATVLATNEAGPPAAGRAFAFVLDDLGMTQGDTSAARRGVSAFLERSVRDGDEVTLLTTSGNAWWSARLPEGREDLLAVLARLKGRGAEPSMSLDAMSDYEAFWIHNHESAAGGDVLARVMERWIQAQICITGPGGQRPESCRQMVHAAATSRDEERRTRTRVVLGAVQRSVQALAPVRGRKSVILFSRGFLEDSAAEARAVAAASREANTAVYFVNVRGLVASAGGPSVADAGAPDPSLSGRMGFEDLVLESAGARSLADDTGGFSVVNTNDLGAAAERVGAESRIFYLLGFEAPPGKGPRAWRKLQVSVKKEGLTVRARRGYTLRADSAAGGEDASKAARKEAPSLPPAVQTALDSVHEAAGIPLRAMAYVFEPRPKGTSRVLVAAEFDASRLTFQGTGKERAARLEVTIAATARDTGKTLYSDARVEVRAPEGEAPGWRAVTRDFDLAPGVAQARIVVRDPATGTMGAVSHRFEVPAARTLRLGTPIVTDHVVPPAGGQGRPHAALAVHRAFAPGSTLYCEFEVFGAAAGGDGAPHVSSGLQLRAADGTVVRQAPATRIAADRDGRVVRLLGLGLEGLPEGAYELVLDVRDEVGLGQVQRREPFTIAR
jgi:VWFA-related protein